MIIKNVKLYLSERGFPVRIPVSQFDSMWRFVFEVIKDNVVWDIPVAATVTMNGLKPDGNVFAFAGSISNNKVTVDCDVQMTAVAGDTLCELSFVSSGLVVGTANFILAVEAAPKSPDDISSESTLPAYAEIIEDIAGVVPRILPPGGSLGQVLAKNSGNDYDARWVDQSGGGSSVEPYTSTPSDLGTASAGSSDKYSRGDHVHKMPTASEVGAYALPSGGIPATDLASAVQTSLGKADSALQSVPNTYRTAAAQDAIDATKEDKVTEVTVSTAGAVTQALDAGKIYHFTGALTALTITLTTSSRTAHYHFDFDCGSTAPTVTLPSSVVMPSGNFEANKHYEVDILNGYGAVMSWATS